MDMNIANAPKTTTFQMRINPEIKEKLEDIYAKNGLTLTDAINVFLQQSLNSEGLPFLVSPENAAYIKAKAAQLLMAELEKGLESGEKHGWISEKEADRLLEGDE